MVNGYQGQLLGPFKGGRELMLRISENAIEDVTKLSHLGIQAYPHTIVLINYEEFEIGQTGMYEVNNCSITSLRFMEDMDNNTIIDYTIEY